MNPNKPEADKAAEENYLEEIPENFREYAKNKYSVDALIYANKHADIIPSDLWFMLADAFTSGRLQSSQSGKERAALDDKSKKELLMWIEKRFRTFGGEDIHNSAEWNPIAAAQKGKPLQFAAGVDVEQVIDYIEDFMQARQALSGKQEDQDGFNSIDWDEVIEMVLNDSTYHNEGLAQKLKNKFQPGLY